MSRRVVGVLVGVVGLAAAGCADGPDPASTALIEPADVVAVAAQPCDRPTARNGVGVDLGDGAVLTAAHTVDGPLRRLVVDGTDVDLLAIDAERDLALIGPADVAAGDAITELAVIHVVDVAAGAEVDVLAGPSGSAGSSETVAVTVDRTVRLVVDDVTDDRRSERRSHVVRPGLPAGTSGAPVVDADGRLVGVVALTSRRNDESFVVAGDEVASFLDFLADHAASSAATESGRSFTVGACE